MIAIQLTQANYDQNPTDWRNTFNLALCYLVADHSDVAEALYCQALTTGAPLVRVRETIYYLKDFSTLFPDHLQAHQTLRLLQENMPDLP